MNIRRHKHPQDYVYDQPYLSGSVTGLIAGLAVGFLFAPKSGRNLRKQIVGTFSDHIIEVQRQWDKTKAQARETIDTIKTNVGLATYRVEGEWV